jgi:hypothetical protein
MDGAQGPPGADGIEGAQGVPGPLQNVGPSSKDTIDPLIINDGQSDMNMCRGSGELQDWDHDDDANTDPQDLCGVNLEDYFYDANGDVLTFETTVMSPNLSVAKLIGLDSPGVYGVQLKALPTIVQAPFIDESGEEEPQPAGPYDDVTVEVMASDGEGLWTTQTFMVRRNRRPVPLPDTNDATDGPEQGDLSIVVGSAGDGTVTKDNPHHVTLDPDSYFGDDDPIELGGQLDDYSVAYVMDGADGKLIVVGSEDTTTYETVLYIRAVDSGGLDSIQQPITVNVDPAPTLHKDNRLDDDIRVILEQTAPAFAIQDIDRYFTQKMPSAGEPGAGEETLAICVTSDNHAVATPNGTGTDCAGGPSGVVDGDLQVTLRSVGDATIEVTATEPPGDGNTPLQSARLSFKLIVDSE